MIVHIFKLGTFKKFKMDYRLPPAYKDAGIRRGHNPYVEILICPEDLEYPVELKKAIEEYEIYRGRLKYYDSHRVKFINDYQIWVDYFFLHDIEYSLQVIISGIEDTVIEKIRELPNVDIFLRNIRSSYSWNYTLTFEENIKIIIEGTYLL